jgi:hypothetical protein
MEVAGSPMLSAIVPATNRPPTLARCVEAIRSSSAPPDELLIVTEPAVAGPAAARNDGAARAHGGVLVFVDADVVVHPDAFARIRAAFDADPGLTALFGSYDDAPEAPGAVSGFRNLLHHHVHQRGAGPAQTFWAGLGAVRRGPFLAAGGFDAAGYPRPSIEDIELGTRLIAAGGRIELDPDVQGTHLKGWALPEMLWVDVSRRGVPWLLLLLRSRTDATALNLGWRHRLSMGASVLGLAALASRRGAAAAGAGVALVALNRSFYALLLRRRGPGQALVGVGIHALHHLAGAASVPVALAAHAARTLREARAGR